MFSPHYRTESHNVHLISEDFSNSDICHPTAEMSRLRRYAPLCEQERKGGLKYILPLEFGANRPSIFSI